MHVWPTHYVHSFAYSPTQTENILREHYRTEQKRRWSRNVFASRKRRATFSEQNNDIMVDLRKSHHFYVMWRQLGQWLAAVIRVFGENVRLHRRRETDSVLVVRMFLKIKHVRYHEHFVGTTLSFSRTQTKNNLGKTQYGNVRAKCSLCAMDLCLYLKI